MGRKITKVLFVPGQNEQIETTISLQKEARSVIHGVVVDEQKLPIKDAVVKLFEMPQENNCCTLIPLFHAFTDECGQFLFGPLTPGKQYVIKVWHKEVKIRKIPGTPFECTTPCTAPEPPNPCKDPCNSQEAVNPYLSTNSYYRYQSDAEDNSDPCNDSCTFDL